MLYKEKKNILVALYLCIQVYVNSLIPIILYQ